MNLKKILILFIILFPKLVNASDFHKIEGTCIESSTCKKEEIKKYNTYTVNYIDMGYLEDNNDYVKDEEDYIEIEGDEYISVKNYNKNVSSIEFQGLSTDFKISELEIYYKDEQIKYTPRKNFYVQFPERLNDNDLETYYTHGNDASFLVLFLDQEYDIDNLTIKIFTKEQDDINISLNIGSNINLSNNKDRWHIIEFQNANSDIIENKIEKLKKYKYFKEEKTINNIYALEGDNIILDDYIVEYEYYVKDMDNNVEKVIEKASKKYEPLTISNEDRINIKTLNNLKTLNYEKKDIKESLENINEEQPEIINDINKSYNIVNDYKEVAHLDSTESLEIDNNIKNKDVEQMNTNTKNNNKNIRILISLILVIIDIILIIRKRKRKYVESI